MKWYKVCFTALGLMMLSSSSSVAADFDWMVNLNVRSHADPYGYRYSLVDRFGYREPEVMVILTSVYDPADAYMIFRLAELSGRPPEYILRVYQERRHHGWGDVGHHLGIRIDGNEFMELRERYDTRYIYLPRGHYEDRRNMPVRKVYIEPRRDEHYQPERRDYDRNRDRDDRRDTIRDNGRDERRDHRPHNNNDRNDDRRDDRR